MKIYYASQISDFFFDKAKKESRGFTSMQSIKLTYIAHGWHLAYFNEPLINENIVVTQYGPMINSLYSILGKKYGSGGISDFINFKLNNFQNNTLALLNSCYASYKTYSGLELSVIATAKSNNPWKKSINENLKIIPNSYIKEYYINLINEFKK